MAKGRNKRPQLKSPPIGKSPQPKSPPSRTRRRRVWTVVLVGAVGLAMAGLGWYLWDWYVAPAPPAVSFADADPVVAETIEAARQDVRWKPRSAAAWGQLGQLLCAHRYIPESNLCFAQAERLDPNDARWPYLQGVSLQSDDPEAALRHLRRAVVLGDSLPDALPLGLAEVCLQQGNLDEAEQHFRQVLRRDPDNARAHLGLGRLASARGNLRDGLAHLNRSASSKRTQKAACILLAQVYHQLGDTAAADRERARVTDLPEDPPWPDPFVEETRSLMAGKQARLDRLKTLHRQGRRAEAREVARKLEEDFPDVYWLVEGREQLAKGNVAAAEQALRKALQLAPASVDAHVDLGTVLLEQKNYRAAAECFRKATELEPGYGLAWQSLGRCWMLQGNRPEAVRAFRLAVQYTPQHAEAHRDLGSLLAQEGQVAEARVHLRQALQLEPGDTKARELLDELSKRSP